MPTLMIGPESRGFIDDDTGVLRLRRALLPVAATPSPRHALLYVANLLAPLGVTGRDIHLMTVGDEPVEIVTPDGKSRSVEHLHGPVAETILQAARDRDVDLIAMPTGGRHGFLDLFRGSTTSRVLPHAPCPVLSLPIIGG
jgi:nucleotide-binding universal stress UspA family protein